MKKTIQTTILILLSVYYLNARPVTVTVNYPGSFVRTDRSTDPSTCRTFDRIICDPGYSICYTITYTYDDGTVANNGNGLEEGIQNPPIYVIISNSNGDINQGLVSNYNNYPIYAPPPLLFSF